MRLIFRLLTYPLLLSALLFAAACDRSQNATQDAPVVPTVAPKDSANASSPRADVVHVEASAVDAAAGSAAEAFVRLKIAEGFHIHANPATLPNLIATELKIEANEANAGIAAGAPVYPASVTKKFEFSEQPLKVYEGDAVIKVPLRIEASAAKGAHQLQAKLRAQACDNQACYPPRTIETFIPVNVR